MPSLTPSTNAPPMPTTAAGRSRRSSIGWRSATTYVFDRQGRQAAIVDPLLNRTTFGYNAYSRPLFVQNPLGQVTTYLRDSMNRLTGLIDARGYRTSYSLRCQLSTPADHRPPQRDHDVSLRPVGAAGGDDRSARRADYVRLRSGGNRIAVINPLNERTTSLFDLCGRMIAQVDPLLNRTTFVFDPAGNQQRVVNALNYISHDSLRCL